MAILGGPLRRIVVAIPCGRHAWALNPAAMLGLSTRLPCTPALEAIARSFHLDAGSATDRTGFH